MAHYIDKDALVAEIDNRIKKYTLLQQKPEMSDLQEELQNKIDCLNSIKGYILNTLEVKEVDLKEKVERFAKECGYKSAATIDFQFAKHFFELGLSVSNSTKVTHRTKADVDAAMAEIEEKSKAFTEAHKGETAEEILAQMRGEEPVSKVWHDSSETPKDTRADIIIEGDVLNTKLFYACCTFENPFLKWKYVKRWVYIDDILKL